MKSIRSSLTALVFFGALVACATQSESRTGVMSQQPTSGCLRDSVPCMANADCCSRRCGAAVCMAPLESPESIQSRSPDDLPSDPPSGLGTPGGHEGNPR